MFERDRFKFTYLLVSMIAVVVLHPLFSGGGAGSKILALGTAIVMLSAIKACAGRRGVLFAAVILASPAVALLGADSMSNLAWLTPARSGAVALFMVFTTTVVLRDVLTSRDVTSHTSGKKAGMLRVRSDQSPCSALVTNHTTWPRPNV